MTNNTLSKSAIFLANEVCGSPKAALEIITLGEKLELKSEYWWGVYHAIKAQDRI